MTIYEISFVLSDGRAAKLRSPRIEDAKELIDYLTATAGETDYLMKYPEELDGFTVESEINFVKGRIDSTDNVMLVCEVEGRIAGVCDLGFSSRIKTRHRAGVAIALLKDYWRLGIGTKMFETMIELAEKRPFVTQMELDFIEGNSRARCLYEKMGFRIAGVHPDAIRLKDGTMLNEYLMIKKL